MHVFTWFAAFRPIQNPLKRMRGEIGSSVWVGTTSIIGYVMMPWWWLDGDRGWPTPCSISMHVGRMTCPINEGHHRSHKLEIDSFAAHLDF